MSDELQDNEIVDLYLGIGGALAESAAFIMDWNVTHPDYPFSMVRYDIECLMN